MDDNKKETLVWDNIPEWAIFHWNTASKKNSS